VPETVDSRGMEMLFLGLGIFLSLESRQLRLARRVLNFLLSNLFLSKSKSWSKLYGEGLERSWIKFVHVLNE
jgi:hypothetical protein